MKVIWSDLAIEDLGEIAEYIAKDSPERAESFVMELIDLGDSLGIKGQERKGTCAKWIDNINVRELYYYHYTIVYEVITEYIYIHEVHHTARLPRTIQHRMD